MGANTLQNEKKISHFKRTENTRLHLGSAFYYNLMPSYPNDGWDRSAVSTALVKGYNGCLPWEQQQWGVRVPHAVYFFLSSRQFHYHEFVPQDWSKELR